MEIPTERGRSRVIIENVEPEIDSGRFAIKRVVGDVVRVRADAYTDGHDAVTVHLKYRRADAPGWSETLMEPLLNDRWEASFTVSELARYEYTVEAWVDRFKTWQRDFKKRLKAGQDVTVDLHVGASLVGAGAERAQGAAREALAQWADRLRDAASQATAIDVAIGDEIAQLMGCWPDRRLSAEYGRTLAVAVDRPRARSSAWYEFFPRSASPEPGRHGTLRDCEAWLARIAGMGFDVVYLPPIHPIGETHRKGVNNARDAAPGDVGSPWAIGSAEGGHKSIHPQLGTMEDFRRLVATANSLGIELALDIAFQCSPDHPYVREHPEWFRQRPDGSVQYAENPPKKYEDIYPFDFETEAWPALWEELKSVVLFWADEGVRIFRVDNPHTKPLPFWEWLIAAVRRVYPETIFLAEAFTRPKVMNYLAKAGFTQSYTYFTWRNTKWELTRYLKDLTETELSEYFRPNFWPNTPDILPEYLQYGGRPACVARLVLAATLSPSYGIYGPPFEICEARPREPGSEEYLDSEKYQLRHWALDRESNLEHLLRRVNQIRRENPALQTDAGLQFHEVDNPEIIAYTRQSADCENLVLVIVNLDVYHTQSGWVTLPLEELGLALDRPYQAHDMLGDARFLWYGPQNFIQLNPQISPAHIFRVRRQVRREQQFEYFM